MIAEVDSFEQAAGLAVDILLLLRGALTTVNELECKPKVAHRHSTVYPQNPEGVNLDLIIIMLIYLSPLHLHQ